VLDPFGASGRPCSSFNPLAELDPDSWDVVDDTAMCAEALIVHPEKGERYWTEAAQALLQAIILLVLREPEDRRNLVTVRRVPTEPM
jgi:type IV secretion system protein VirD4